MSSTAACSATSAVLKRIRKPISPLCEDMISGTSLSCPFSVTSLSALQSGRIQSSCGPLFRSNLINKPRKSLQLRQTFSTAAANKQVSSRAQTNSPPITSDSYPEIRRDARYKKVTAEDVQYFSSVLRAQGAVVESLTQKTDEDDLVPYNSDWSKKYRGQSQVVLKPSSTAEVSKILAYCHQEKLAVVPQGGNTGLVGGSVPIFDEVIISLSRMNTIQSFDETTGIAVVDAGCILETVDAHLAKHDFMFPLDLGAKGSCQIGGNVATNAGGLRLLRYGSLHGNVLGLEAVLPDGTVLNDLSLLRKNNTGYDTKQLFIGSEGTIGIITAVSILCVARPQSRHVAFFGLESFDKVLEAFRVAKRSLSEILSAFELMDGQSQEIIARMTQKKRPLEKQYPFYCLVETNGSNAAHDGEKLEQYFEKILEEQIVDDGVLAQDETQVNDLWSWRESIPESLGHVGGGVYKYDVSIPLKDFYKLVEDTRTRLKSQGLLGPDAPVTDVVGFGHMGDSNLHLNVVTRKFGKRIEKALEPFVYEWIARHKGSISAEHGLGLAKRPFVNYSRNETSLEVMNRIKGLFDPSRIMNPYKYI